MRQPHVGELLGREQRGDHEQGRRREDHADGHADLRERAEEAAARGGRVLDGHQRRAAPFATGREALQDAEQDQQDRSGDADRGVGRQEADECGGQAHQDEREHQHLLAAEPVAEIAGDDRAERTEQERDADRREREHLGEPGVRLGHGGEEERREHQAGCLGVDEEVVPLDGGTDERAGEDLAFLTGHALGAWCVVDCGRHANSVVLGVSVGMKRRGWALVVVDRSGFLDRSFGQVIEHSASAHDQWKDRATSGRVGAVNGARGSAGTDAPSAGRVA